MTPTDQDPLWYKDAVIYQIHVRAFFDSNDDGIGDFRGLTQKLDYIRDLGVNTLWLLPFYPSPLKDDGYDIADYTDVHPSYGTLDDFRAFRHVYRNTYAFEEVGSTFGRSPEACRQLARWQYLVDGMDRKIPISNFATPAGLVSTWRTLPRSRSCAARSTSCATGRTCWWPTPVRRWRAARISPGRPSRRAVRRPPAPPGPAGSASPDAR